MNTRPAATSGAVPQADQARFEMLTAERLEALMAVEQSAYSHPWTRGNFMDAMAAGHQCLLLLGGLDELLGYFVAMRGVDEVHLLNITVAPKYQHQGWAWLLLDALDLWARAQSAHCIWLEVRVSNTRARAIYEQHGYRLVGQRKGYYPAADGQREDAFVMSLAL